MLGGVETRAHSAAFPAGPMVVTGRAARSHLLGGNHLANGFALHEGELACEFAVDGILQDALPAAQRCGLVIDPFGTIGMTHAGTCVAQVDIDPIVVGFEVFVGERPVRPESIRAAGSEIKRTQARRYAGPPRCSPSHVPVAAPIPTFTRRLVVALVLVNEIFRPFPAFRSRFVKGFLQLRVRHASKRLVEHLERSQVFGRHRRAVLQVENFHSMRGQEMSHHPAAGSGADQDHVIDVLAAHAFFS